MQLLQLFGEAGLLTAGCGDAMLAYEIGDVTADSRRCGADSLFVCIRGAHYDGHAYAMDAYRRGCRVFVAARALSLPEDAACFLVSDTTRALAFLSAALRGKPAEGLLLIGVTGTKGKTEVSVAAAQALSACGIPCGVIGTCGAAFGDYREATVNTTPDSEHMQAILRRMADRGARAVVTEVSSQALMTGRATGLRFPVAVFTNLAPDHVGQGEHRDFEEYRACKARLFAEHGCETMIYNADDPHAGYFLAASTARRRLSYSCTGEADYMAREIRNVREEDQTLGVCFTLEEAGMRQHLRFGSPGAFQVSNFLAAYGVCRTVLAAADTQVSPRHIARELCSVRVSGRMEQLPLSRGRLVLIDYAHNGYSLRAVLSMLRQYRPTRLTCVVGSVGGRTEGRRADIGAAVSACADRAILTSDNPDRESPGRIIDDIRRGMTGQCVAVGIADREEAIRYAVRTSMPGEFLLIAGKGHEQYQLIDGVRYPFSERRIILDEACLLH